MKRDCETLRRYFREIGHEVKVLEGDGWPLEVWMDSVLDKPIQAFTDAGLRRGAQRQHPGI